MLRRGGWDEKQEGVSMSIESMPEINVDQAQQAGEILQGVSEKNQEVSLLVNVTGSVQSWEKIKAICSKSASGSFSRPGRSR